MDEVQNTNAIDNISYELSDSNSSGGGHAKSEGNPHKNLGIGRDTSMQFFTSNISPSTPLPLVILLWWVPLKHPCDMYFVFTPSSLGAPLLFLLIPMISSFVFIWNLIY